MQKKREQQQQAANGTVSKVFCRKRGKQVADASCPRVRRKGGPVKGQVYKKKVGGSNEASASESVVNATQALGIIKKEQQSTKPAIPRKHFAECAEGILAELCEFDVVLSNEAIRALQQATEDSHKGSLLWYFTSGLLACRSSWCACARHGRPLQKTGMAARLWLATFGLCVTLPAVRSEGFLVLLAKLAETAWG